MSKLVLRDRSIMEMIVTNILGEEAATTYSHRATEWPNGARSDIVYASNIPSPDLPPVLVQVQHTLDHDFVSRSIDYCLSMKKEYGALPIVVIFVVQSTRTELLQEFKESRLSFARELDCKFWANQCYVLTSSTIDEHLSETPLHPMAALEFFFSQQKPSLMASDHRDDPTIQSLYRIAKEQLEDKIEPGDNIASTLMDVCENTSNQFKKILRVTQTLPAGSHRKRLLDYAENGVLYTELCRKKYTTSSSRSVSPMPEPEALPEEARKLLDETRPSRTIELFRQDDGVPKTDMDFVDEFRRDIGAQMDWKKCYESGRLAGFFGKYKNHSSLKRAFYKKAR